MPTPARLDAEQRAKAWSRLGSTKFDVLVIGGGVTGALTVGGAISGVGVSITKNGSGTLQLSGVNTYDGGLTLNAGTLTFGNAAAAGNATGTVTINGGVVDASAALTLGNNPWSWAGDFAFGGGNTLKLGLFGANCSSGRAVMMVPERWSGSWPDCVKLAQMAYRAGIEFVDAEGPAVEEDGVGECPTYVDAKKHAPEATSGRGFACGALRCGAGLRPCGWNCLSRTRWPAR